VEAGTFLSYHVYRENGDLLTFKGNRQKIPEVIYSGGKELIDIDVLLPSLKTL